MRRARKLEAGMKNVWIEDVARKKPRVRLKGLKITRGQRTDGGGQLIKKKKRKAFSERIGSNGKTATESEASVPAAYLLTASQVVLDSLQTRIGQLDEEQRFVFARPLLGHEAIVVLVRRQTVLHTSSQSGHRGVSSLQWYRRVADVVCEYFWLSFLRVTSSGFLFFLYIYVYGHRLSVVIHSHL